MKEGSFLKVKKNPGPGTYEHKNGLTDISYSMRPKTSNPCNIFYIFILVKKKRIIHRIKGLQDQAHIIMFKPFKNLGSILFLNINAMEFIYIINVAFN